MIHEITLRKKAIWLLMLFFACLFTGYIILKQPVLGNLPPTEPDLIKESLLINGLEAFFSIEYSVGYNTWLDNYCTVSSESGCKIMQNVYGPSLWSFVEKYKFSTKCKAKVNKVVEIGEDFEVWQTVITLSTPFPNQSSTQTIYAMIILQPDKQWAFERVLTDQETKIYE